MIKLGYLEIDIKTKYQDEDEIIGKLYQRLLLIKWYYSM